MRLVTIASGEGYVRPIHRGAGGYPMQCALKTMEPAIEFRRESDLFAEQLGKATAAEAGLSGHFEDAPNVWSPSKFLKRILDGRMQFEPRVHSSQKRDFELAELVGGSGRFSQAVAQRVGHRTPNKIERYAFVKTRRRARPRVHGRHPVERALRLSI